MVDQGEGLANPSSIIGPLEDVMDTNSLINPSPSNHHKETL